MNKMRSLVVKNFDAIRMLVAILIGILIAFGMIFLISDNPLLAIEKLFLGPLQSIRRFGNVIELMIPLVFAGLSVCVMFSANQFNLGTEGAIYAGGAVAAFIVLTIPFPSPILAISVAAIVGGCICGLTGLLKVKFGTNELVTSLMLNYVVYYGSKYILLSGSLKDPSAGYPGTFKFPVGTMLNTVVTKTRIHSGLFIMLVAVIVIGIYMNRTRGGFATRIVGENQKFANYSGIKVASVILISQVIGGVLAGVGGAVQILGMYERFQWTALPGYGFDGVIVAILARKNPWLVPLAAFFLAYLRIGSDVMSTSTDVTNELISIIQGIIILFVSATAFLSYYQQKLIVKEATNNE